MQETPKMLETVKQLMQETPRTGDGESQQDTLLQC